MKRFAVVLCNLGGPDKPESVKPFLFNLFNDPAIIGLPNPFRWLLARLISSRREKEAQEIYSHIGGHSPILEHTKQQASVLERILNHEQDAKFKTFIIMRYWHPRSREIIEQLKEFNPDGVIFLPLYPQFSTTTTRSSLREFADDLKKASLTLPMHVRCCYPTEQHFIHAHADLIRTHYEQAKAHGKPRILFSAHGLPQKIVDAGDPYQWQVEQSVAAICEQLDIEGLDSMTCYQSRVGPLKWLEPSTEVELKRAAQDGVPIVLVPIAFVSEHSETLVELDIQYRDMLKEYGDISYSRVPALQTHQRYMESLKQQCLEAVRDPSWQESGELVVRSSEQKRLCPKEFCDCMMQESA